MYYYLFRLFVDITFCLDRRIQRVMDAVITVAVFLLLKLVLNAQLVVAMNRCLQRTQNKISHQLRPVMRTQPLTQIRNLLQVRTLMLV